MAPSRPRISDVSHTPTLSSQGRQNYANDNLPPLFNTTFSTHRLSPLFLGAEGLTAARLLQLANRLRDILVGDVVRGIQIGLESTDTPVGQVGALRTVKIRWFQASDVLGGNVTETQDGDSESRNRGLWIQIRHENAAYVALLLPAKKLPAMSGWEPQTDENQIDPSENSDRFLHLPLLLLRMPLALKQVIGNWLATTFDCRVSKLSLGTRTLVNVWEEWIQISGLRAKGPDFVITLAFNAPLVENDGSARTGSEDEGSKPDSAQAGLRSMDITISPQDLRRFTRAGRTVHVEKTMPPWQFDPRERHRLAGGNVDDGWAWRAEKEGPAQPFTEALAHYLDHHLALNLFHPSVRIVQISCGGFVLGQSKLKIVRNADTSSEASRAAWMFITQLGKRVGGDDIPTIF